MSNIIKWEKRNFRFLNKGDVVSTEEIEKLREHYLYDVMQDGVYKITGYKEDLFSLVYDICYGEYVSAYQNIMMDKYMRVPAIMKGPVNKNVANIIANSCFRIAVIKLSNLFKDRADQLYSLKTLEVLIKDRFGDVKFDDIRSNNTEVIEFLNILRNKFYAHRDANCEVDMPMALIWNLIEDCDSYFTSIANQIGEPTNYQNYEEVNYHVVCGFIRQC